MHNWYAIESEAEFRRQEWERAVAADVRASQAKVERNWLRRLQLPRLALHSLKLTQAPQLGFAASGTSSQTADCSC